MSTLPCKTNGVVVCTITVCYTLGVFTYLPMHYNVT